MAKNVVKDKSFLFAIDIVNLCKELNDQKEYIISKQILRSGTAIGALVREAEQAESLKDFIHKFSIALKLNILLRKNLMSIIKNWMNLSD